MSKLDFENRSNIKILKLKIKQKDFKLFFIFRFVIKNKNDISSAIIAALLFEASKPTINEKCK